LNLTDIGVIKAIQDEFGFRFSKGLGQNFLTNPTVCPKIAEMGCEPGSGVIEIGAGFGVLTKELCKLAGKVVCIELDKSLLPVLEKTVPAPNLTVINADILKCDLRSIIAEHFSAFNKVYVCANLPYYITSPVIMKLLEERLLLAAITVMVQKEAADRLAAQCGTREAGAVTYAVRYLSEPEILFNVSRGSFYPPPNVDSAVLRLVPHGKPPIETGCSNEDELRAFETFLFRLIKAAFSQRRKTFANAVSAGTGIPKADIFAILSDLGLNSDIRPERLTLEDFAAVTKKLLALSAGNAHEQ
jgi:16S rRNA (adenine1518-N6/adenine1519-N6)-dimethyltransferase